MTDKISAPAGFYCESRTGSVCLYCCGEEGGHRQGIRCQEGGCLELVSDAVINLARTNVFYCVPPFVSSLSCHRLPSPRTVVSLARLRELVSSVGAYAVSRRASSVANVSTRGYVASLCGTVETALRPFSDMHQSDVVIVKIIVLVEREQPDGRECDISAQLYSHIVS